MVSGHRASFPVSRAAPCGGLASLTRQAGPGNGVLPPRTAPAPCAIVAASAPDFASARIHIRLICIRPGRTTRAAASSAYSAIPASPATKAADPE